MEEEEIGHYFPEYSSFLPTAVTATVPTATNPDAVREAVEKHYISESVTLLI